MTYTTRTIGRVTTASVIALTFAAFALPDPAFADATAPCNNGAQAGSTECGTDSVASAVNATALGQDSDATMTNATALGRDADATSVNATAVGSGATASNGNTVALGYRATASGGSSVAIGGDAFDADTLGARASGDFAIAIGSNTTASMSSAIAIGHDANASGAIAQGNLAFASGDSGIAAAVAMATAPFPSAPGKTSYTAATGVYRGAVAFSASVSHRLNTSAPFAIIAGVSHAGSGDTAARAGVSGEF